MELNPNGLDGHFSVVNFSSRGFTCREEWGRDIEDMKRGVSVEFRAKKNLI